MKRGVTLRVDDFLIALSLVDRREERGMSGLDCNQHRGALAWIARRRGIYLRPKFKGSLEHGGLVQIDRSHKNGGGLGLRDFVATLQQTHNPSVITHNGVPLKRRAGAHNAKLVGDGILRHGNLRLKRHLFVYIREKLGVFRRRCCSVALRNQAIHLAKIEIKPSLERLVQLPSRHRIRRLGDEGQDLVLDGLAELLNLFRTVVLRNDALFKLR